MAVGKAARVCSPRANSSAERRLPEFGDNYKKIGNRFGDNNKKFGDIHTSGNMRKRY